MKLLRGRKHIYLDEKSEGLVSGSTGKYVGVNSLEEGSTNGLAFLVLNSPSFVPVDGTGLQHVVSMPPGDGDKGDSHGVVAANLLD